VVLSKSLLMQLIDKRYGDPPNPLPNFHQTPTPTYHNHTN
jgi:hypothetical protein